MKKRFQLPRFRAPGSRDPSPSAPPLEAWRRALAELALERSAGLSAGGQVLEMGCGPGDLTLALAALHPEAELIGLDPSTDAIRQATTSAREARLGRRVRFERAEAGLFPLPNGSMDLVFAMDPPGGAQRLPNLLDQVKRVIGKRGRGYVYFAPGARQAAGAEGALNATSALIDALAVLQDAWVRIEDLGARGDLERVFELTVCSPG